MTEVHDDDALDLSAWQPPAPPDVTDAVIDRMHAPARSAPVRWWLVGSVAAALAGVAAIAIIALHDGNDDLATPGQLVAARPQHLVLAGATVDVDPGTTLHWQHDRDGLRVAQRGTATWSVADRLRVAAGAVSIEASAANLRVEVEMNRQDLQVIGTSALTAAAVALVTVIVYDGHVRATSAGQTVTLPPGTTFQIVPEHAPRQVDQLVGAAPVAPAPPAVPPVPPPPPEPPVTPSPPLPSAEGDRLRAECLDQLSKKQWVKLADCAQRLTALEPARGKELAALAARELEAGQVLAKLRGTRDRTAARPLVDAIPLDSVYKAEALQLYDALPASAKPPSPFDTRTRPPDPVKPGPAAAPLATRCQPMGKVDRTSTDPECGALVVLSSPSAKIILDGLDTGKQTPIGPLELTPGKHKITFVVGGDERFTFAVDITTGETTKLVKNLQ